VAPPDAAANGQVLPTSSQKAREYSPAIWTELQK
jgi:hypothetical protein